MSRMTTVSFLVASLAQFMITSHLPAQDANPSEFFKVAYRAQRAERDRIKTWSGKLHCQELAYFPSPPKDVLDSLKAGQQVAFREIRFESEFFIDVTRGRAFSTFHPIEKIHFLDSERKVLASTEERGYNNRALVGERALTLRPWQASGRQRDDPKTDGWKAYKSRIIEASTLENAKGRGPIGDVIDPIQLFDPPAYDFIGYLQLLSEVTDADYFTSLKLRRERAAKGDEFVWGSGDPPSRHTAEYRVGEYVGYHLVGYRLHDQQNERDTCDVKIEYDKVSGVFVPRKYQLVKTSSDGGHLQISRSYEISEQILNQPQAESIFTMKHLGAEPGDRVINAEARTLEMVNGSLDVVSVSEFERAYSNGFGEHGGQTSRRDREPVQTKQRVQMSDRTWWVLVLNGVVVSTLVLFWMGARWRRRLR